MDENGYYTGVDFERRVYGHLGLGSLISGTSITQRSNRIDAVHVEEALNLELLELWQQLAEKAPERVTLTHDFTYPASTERVWLRGPAPVSAVLMNPPLPRPWLDLVRLQDRTTALDEAPIRKVDIDDFYRYDGPRWAYHTDALYYSETAQVRGPGSARALRLDWVPSRPIAIARASIEPRTDIPVEAHEAIVLGAARRMAVQVASARLPMITSEYDRQMARALRGLSVNAAQPIFTNYDKAPLSAWR